MIRKPIGFTLNNSRHGVALIEVACWIVLILPLLMVGIGLLASAHEHTIVRLIPESLMRETATSTATWLLDPTAESLQADAAELETVITALAERAVIEGHQRSLKLRNISARSCYWIYDVDSRLGAVKGVLRSRCIPKGRFGADLSLEEVMSQRVELGISQPIALAGSDTHTYLPYAILVGVALAGEFNGIGALYPVERMEHASVWIPRRGMKL
jgi:hypothetical protein